jgi:hypothetical protein
MLIQFGQDFSNYLYDVFIAKFDFWLGFGLVAQLFFTARFLVQWISSERAGRSVVPMAFWIFSMGGGLMTGVGHYHLCPQYHADREESRERIADLESLGHVPVRWHHPSRRIASRCSSG